MTRLCLVLSHLCKRKLRHSFQDCPNPLRFCFISIETSTHDLLHHPTNKSKRMTLLDKIKSINCDILELSDTVITKIVLFGYNFHITSYNTLILQTMHVY